MAERALERVDVIRSGAVARAISLPTGAQASLRIPLEGLEPGEFVYLRVLQVDGGAAWSSPYFVGADADADAEADAKLSESSGTSRPPSSR